MYCENCFYYNPMDGEEGFCDNKNIVVEYNDCYCCHSDSECMLEESIGNGDSPEEF